MKFTIKNILIAFFLFATIIESQSARQLIMTRLGRIINKIGDYFDRTINNYNNVDLDKYIDINCVNSFLNLPQNKALILNELEEIIFKISSVMKCSIDTDTAFAHIR